MYLVALPHQQDGGIGNAYARTAILSKIVEFCCLLHGTGHVALPSVVLQLSAKSGPLSANIGRSMKAFYFLSPADESSKHHRSTAYAAIRSSDADPARTDSRMSDASCCTGGVGVAVARTSDNGSDGSAGNPRSRPSNALTEAGKP